MLKIIPLTLAPKKNKILNRESENFTHSNLGNISERNSRSQQ